MLTLGLLFPNSLASPYFQMAPVQGSMEVRGFYTTALQELEEQELVLQLLSPSTRAESSL
jgi:hypothetical protein